MVLNHSFNVVSSCPLPCVTVSYVCRRLWLERRRPRAPTAPPPQLLQPLLPVDPEATLTHTHTLPRGHSLNDTAPGGPPHTPAAAAAGVLSRVSFGWLTPLFTLGATRQLGMADIDRLPRDLGTGLWDGAFSRVLAQARRGDMAPFALCGRPPVTLSLLRVLLAVFGRVSAPPLSAVLQALVLCENV